MKVNLLLKKIKLKNLLDKLGIKNQRPLDDNIMMSCPFHEDNNPSCGIHKKTGQYHCFSCGESGSLIQLIAKIKSITNKEAVQYLNKLTGQSKGTLLISSKTIYRQLKKIIIGKKRQPVKQEKQYNIELPLNLTENYQLGIQYFKSRGIDQTTLKRYHISFCTEGFYRNRAIIPIFKADGSFLTFEARDITGMAEKKVLYPKGTKVNTTLFNLYKAKLFNYVIVVEGLMDTLYLSQRGFNVVSTYGVNMSEIQECLLSQYFQKVYLASDGDRAGRIATIKYGNSLELHLSVYVITLAKDTDPDSYSKNEFKRLYDKAIPFQEYITKKIMNKILDK